MPAPIALFCYNRPGHLRKTVESLLENDMAAESELVIFSDAARGPGHHADVENVREYIRHIHGFRSVEIRLSEKNQGLAASVLKGVSEIIAVRGKVIVMEDDMLTTPDFLSFMNRALDTYQANPLIFSVSGYSFGLEFPEDYTSDVALVQRASSWGWGTWADRWTKVDWNVSDFNTFLKDKRRVDQLKNAGEDMLPMIIKQQRGLIHSWAIRWTYHHVKYKGYCLIPVRSKVNNIGTDGSGTNFTSYSERYKVSLDGEEVRLDEFPEPDSRVIATLRKKNRPGFIRRLINLYKFGIW